MTAGACDRTRIVRGLPCEDDFVAILKANTLEFDELYLIE